MTWRKNKKKSEKQKSSREKAIFVSKQPRFLNSLRDLMQRSTVGNYISNMSTLIMLFKINNKQQCLIKYKNRIFKWNEENDYTVHVQYMKSKLDRGRTKQKRRWGRTWLNGWKGEEDKRDEQNKKNKENLTLIMSNRLRKK